VRIEAGEHPVDRALDQGAVVDLVDIVRADPLEHGHELVEFLIGADVDRADRRSEGSGQHAGAEQACGTQQGLRHQLRPLQISYAPYSLLRVREIGARPG
jgi:hypothetical protein